MSNTMRLLCVMEDPEIPAEHAVRIGSFYHPIDEQTCECCRRKWYELAENPGFVYDEELFAPADDGDGPVEEEKIPSEDVLEAEGVE